YNNCLLISRSDGRGNNIPGFPVDLFVFMIFSSIVLNMAFQPACFGGVRSDLYKLVAPVDIQPMRYRTNAVSWIMVTVALEIVLGTPAGYAARSGTKVLVFIKNEGCQVMLVSAARVNHFSKQTFTHDIQGRHHIPAVADIFKHHARHPGAFGGVHQLRAVSHRQCSRYFHTRILAVLHSRYCLSRVEDPRRSNNNAVNIIALAKIGVLFLLQITSRALLAGLLYQIEGTVQVLFFRVKNGRNLHVITL